jgi:hypothetical protein
VKEKEERKNKRGRDGREEDDGEREEERKNKRGRDGREEDDGEREEERKEDGSGSSQNDQNNLIHNWCIGGC